MEQRDAELNSFLISRHFEQQTGKVISHYEVKSDVYFHSTWESRAKSDENCARYYLDCTESHFVLNEFKALIYFNYVSVNYHTVCTFKWINHSRNLIIRKLLAWLNNLRAVKKNNKLCRHYEAVNKQTQWAHMRDSDQAVIGRDLA